MNVAADVALNKAAFMDWLQWQKRRCELRRGRPVVMIGVSRVHMRLCMQFAFAFRQRLDLARYDVTVADFAVEVAQDTIRYPDVMVEARGGLPKERTTSEPLILVEVLSPSSTGVDFREKPAEYLALPSLHAYVIASQDEPLLWAWVRGDDGSFPKEPAALPGPDGAGALRVALFASAIPLSEIYGEAGAGLR